MRRATAPSACSRGAWLAKHASIYYGITRGRQPHRRPSISKLSRYKKTEPDSTSRAQSRSDRRASALAVVGREWGWASVYGKGAGRGAAERTCPRRTKSARSSVGGGSYLASRSYEAVWSPGRVGGEESHVGAGAPRSKRAAAALVFSPRGHCGLLRFGMERYVCGWRRTLSAHIHRGGSPRELREAVGPLVMEAAFAAHSHYGLYCCEQRLSCFECVCMCGEDSRNRRAPTLRGGLPRGLAQATVAPLAVRASRCRRAATTVSIR